jgi:hypothetical protein
MHVIFSACGCRRTPEAIDARDYLCSCSSPRRVRDAVHRRRGRYPVHRCRVLHGSEGPDLLLELPAGLALGTSMAWPCDVTDRRSFPAGGRSSAEAGVRPTTAQPLPGAATAGRPRTAAERPPSHANPGQGEIYAQTTGRLALPASPRSPGVHHGCTVTVSAVAPIVHTGASRCTAAGAGRCRRAGNVAAAPCACTRCPPGHAGPLTPVKAVLSRVSLWQCLSLIFRGDTDWPCQPQLAPQFSFYVAPHSVVPG